MNLKQLEDLCYEDYCLQNPNFHDSLKQAKPILERFCKKYRVTLKRIEASLENPTNPPGLEPLYIFSDNLGGYTFKAIRDSL